MRPVLAEALGSFWIVLVAGALVAEGRVAPGLGAGAAAGIAYLAVALSLGQITMGHFNPALTLGLRAAGGFGGSLTFTLVAQVAGASVALLFVGPAPEPAEEIRGGAAMLLLVPLVALPVLVHAAGMRLRAEAVAYANAAALATAVALAPGGHAGLSAAHATAAWLTGEGAPIGLWRIWLATLVGAGLASLIWGQLAEGIGKAKRPARVAHEGDEADEIAPGADDDDETPVAVGAQTSAALTSQDIATAGPSAIDRAAAMTPAEAALAQSAALDALVEAGWTPPSTKKGRAPKNTPLRTPRQKGKSRP